MKITRQKDSIFRCRDDKSKIHYYIFPEYEVHYGELEPNVVQPWHHHATINETLYIIEGNIKLHYLESGVKKEVIAEPGDVIQVENTPHTFSNPFDKVCRMVAFRFVPIHKNNHEIIKNDKVLHPELD